MDDDNSYLLPAFRTVDIQGNPVNSTSFRGRPTFISYVAPSSARDLDLFISIDRQYGNKINIVAFASKWTTAHEWREHANWLLIQDNNNRIAHLFKAAHPGVNYLFSTEGRLLNSSLNQKGFDEGPKAALNMAICNERFNIRMIYPSKGQNISIFPWLSQLVSLRRTNLSTPFLIFAMFSSICDGCSSGFTLNMLKKIHADLGDSFSIYIILPASFSLNDISRLYSQMNLSIPCLLADSSLMARWDHLNSSFRPSDINEILFITDRIGNIIIDFDKTEKNPQDSFYYECVSLIAGSLR